VDKTLFNDTKSKNYLDLFFRLIDTYIIKVYKGNKVESPGIL